MRLNHPILGCTFRLRSGEREAIPASGQQAEHYQPSRQHGIGAITSRPAASWTFWQMLAFELSGAGDPSRAIVPFCTVGQAKTLHAKGLLQ